MGLRILFVCHRFPYPPKRGGKIRPFNTIKYLTDCGHQVTVASIVRSDEEADEITGIEAHCEAHVHAQIGSIQALWQMLAALPTARPSSLAFFRSAQLQKCVDRLLRENQFDLIWTHCAFAAQYTEHVTDIPRVMDFGDMDSEKWKVFAEHYPWPVSMGYRLESRKLATYESAIARSWSYCTATTQREFETLRSISGATPTSWYPNGVDSDYFVPGTGDYDPFRVTFLGRMDYFPNQQAADFLVKHVMPGLQQVDRRFELYIVGAEPPRAIMNYGSLPGITVTGSVSDVRQYLHRSLLTAVPLEIARGTQNKILESLSAGVPVVTNSNAAKGVDAVPGEHLLIAERPEDYVDTIVRLSREPQLRETLAQAGRKRMLEKHQWDGALDHVTEILEHVVNH